MALNSQLQGQLGTLQGLNGQMSGAISEYDSLMSSFVNGGEYSDRISFLNDQIYSLRNRIVQIYSLRNRIVEAEGNVQTTLQAMQANGCM